MASSNKIPGTGLVLLDSEEVLGSKRPPLMVFEVDTPAGSAWIGSTEGRIAWLSMGDLDEGVLRKYWQGDVNFTKKGPFSSGDLVEAVRGQCELELLPIGTGFQKSVWTELLSIPFSTTVSYGTLAERLGSRKRARAVGAAVGANPIAWLIPCHRVLPESGGLGGYRWGSDIKKSLLNWEGPRDPSGPPGQDSEDRRKLEAMLLNAQRYEDVGKLAGHIAHDLNNLLAPIRMATELLKRKLEDPSVNRYVDIIETSTERARSVIQEILTFSRESESGESEIIEVNPLLRELEAMVSETFPKEVKVRFQYQETAPPVKIDPHQLHRSVLNLLVNARDAIGGKGTIEVKVSTHDMEMQVCIGERCLMSGNYVCISVSDDGPGIGKAIRDKIFDPFFTTKPKEEGTGLGLASAYGIIARSGGFIDLQSTEGEGATFHLFLPEAGRAKN